MPVGNLTQRDTYSWRAYHTVTSQYQNNRNTQTTIFAPPSAPQTSYWTYDAAGTVTHDQNKEYTFDAAGNKTRVFETTDVGGGFTKKLWIYQDYDADGERVKRVEQEQTNSGPYSFVTSYYLRSSVLDDSVITELNEYGQKRQTFVYADGAILAKQKDNQVTWVHIDPVTNSARETNSASNVATRVEFDPFGNDAPLTDPQPPEMTPDYEYTGNYGSSGNPYDGASGCSLDGQPVPCSLVSRFINIGAAAICPNNNCGPRFNGTGWEFLHFTDEGMGYGKLNEYAHAQRRTKPTWRKPPQTRQRSRRTKKTEREEPKYPPVTRSEIHLIVFEGEAFQRIQDAIVDAIVDIANRQPCSDAFKKWGLTIPYDVVKSGNLRVGGLMALKQQNAGALLGWSGEQVNIARERFGRQDRIIPWTRQYVAEGVFVGTPTVVFNATAVGMPMFGGLREIVTHAFIHLGGREGNDEDSPHDLAHSPGYQEIIDACK